MGGSAILLEDKEISRLLSYCGQQVLRQENVTVVGTVDFYSRVDEYQLNAAQWRDGYRDHDRLTKCGPSGLWPIPPPSPEWLHDQVNKSLQQLSQAAQYVMLAQLGLC